MNKPDKLEFYVDASGEHRWRLIAANGKIRAAASEGFKNEADCESNAKKTGENLYKIFNSETII